MPSRFGPHKPLAACFLMDGMWSHDMASVIQVFGSTLALEGEDPCELVFVADGEEVQLDHGIHLSTTPISQLDGTADLVCVPGFVDPFAIDERLERAQPVTMTTLPFSKGDNRPGSIVILNNVQSVL